MFFDNANAHECAHLPEPTEADYARLDAALNSIKNKGKTEMTEQTITTETLEEIAETTSVVANELLKQDGWSILAVMQHELIKSVNATSLIMNPVNANITEVKAKVSDPEGFDKVITCLKNDITEIIKTIGALTKLHEGKTGEPTEDELPLVDKISQGYAELQSMVELTVQPLILWVADKLEDAGITSLNVK